MPLLRCGHATKAQPTVKSNVRYKSYYTCPHGCGLQRPETNAKKLRARRRRR